MNQFVVLLEILQWTCIIYLLCRERKVIMVTELKKEAKGE